MALASTGLFSALPSQTILKEPEIKALDYCQKEARFGFGSKSPTWSTHAILLKTTIHHSVIIHLLIAASLAEVASYTPEHQRSMLNTADNHYELGRKLLEEVLDKEEPDPLVVIASFWFLYLHQRRWHSGRRICYAELSKWMRNYLRRRPLHHELSLAYPYSYAGKHEADESTALPPDKRAIVARLIIWLFWADTQASLVGGGLMAQEVAHSLSSGGMISLHETSRSALQLYWDKDYPEEELGDDLQNAAALELVHHTWVLVQEINQHASNAPMDPETTQSIDDRLDLLHDRYPICSVFRLADARTVLRSRLLANADWAVANFYSIRIYNFRCSMTNKMRPFFPDRDADTISLPSGIRKAVSSLTDVLKKSLATGDRQQIDRLQWPLVWAGLETTDPPTQDWILAKLTNPIAQKVVAVVFQEQMNGMRVSMQRMGEICQTECQHFEGISSPVGTPML
ncbi:hypothetical protein OQA88_2250 [Cercophora sp. LCS_1]